MHERFRSYVEGLHPKFIQLTQSCPILCAEKARIPAGPGVYLFSEAETPLYVGRTSKLRQRYGGHCNTSSKQQSAAFAFKLAREQTGFLSASYKVGSQSRKGLMENPKFAAAFENAKGRIRSMEFRCVEEEDSERQALLEIYCAVALGTRYNDFKNH
ncbi:MAG: GIY-YIG nuclease family protein [Pseudomonadota bacterium]|nr:GIY-YIG nuclease family protein [Pseudomonadota bacterium]